LGGQVVVGIEGRWENHRVAGFDRDPDDGRLLRDLDAERMSVTHRLIGCLRRRRLRARFSQLDDGEITIADSVGGLLFAEAVSNIDRRVASHDILLSDLGFFPAPETAIAVLVADPKRPWRSIRNIVRGNPYIAYNSVRIWAHLPPGRERIACPD